MEDYAVKLVTCRGNKTEVLVDKNVEAWFDQYRWSASTNGNRNPIFYVATGIYDPTTKQTKKMLLHRAIMGAEEGWDVDHINRNPLDNRRSNLRIVDRRTNLLNKSKQKTWRGRPTSSGYTGVSKIKGKERWQGYIYYYGKRINLGYFDKEEDAAIAYDTKSRELYGPRLSESTAFEFGCPMIN